MYTRAAYCQLLELMQAEGYHFEHFTRTENTLEKLIYLRHDVDYSPEWALALARIDAAYKARATFCFQLRSPLYNLLAYPTLAAVREIISLGHDIALHYTLDQIELETEEAFARPILADFAFLRQFLPELQPVFSWHNPSLKPQVLERGLDLIVPGLVNMYSRYFTQTVVYCSDSNLRYSVSEFAAIIKAGHVKLQLLFHPFQWLAGGAHMLEILANTWKQVVREQEVEFLNNHIYRQSYPTGMSETDLQRWVKAIATGE